ncbi:ATP-binding protein [Fretibacter rubidus]|uniref:ATP-binding protein n=1 Tax=Fretibacter rubidus TaxID=570162 RepID=UPI00352A0F67
MTTTSIDNRGQRSAVARPSQKTVTAPAGQRAAASAPPYQRIEIGRILSVGSSMAMVSVNKQVIRNNQLAMAQLGTVLKIITSNSIVVAMVSSLKIGSPDEEGLGDGCLARLDILGEITTNPTTRETRFYRGVRSFPVLNEPVYNMSPQDLKLIFSTEKARCIEVGRLQQDNNIVAQVRIDDLLSKHFAIIGSTGSGKSCTVALVLQAILKNSPTAHVVLFDPHNEYSKSFGNLAEVIRPNTLDIPLWMFNFEETCELLTSDVLDQAREEQEVLNDAILKAKRLFEASRENGDVSSQAKFDDIEKSLHRIASHISLDSPVPYRIRDVLKLIDHNMGKLENSSNLGPFKRLKRRIEGLISDPRYQFVFRNQASPDTIANIVGRIFRIPVMGKPISILDFSGIPSEALNIVVAVVSRLAFELAMWSERKIPILLVCEEAHRYIPADKSLGFHSTRRAISRIAKEGRKYGVSLAIVSQRPSELEPSTLSQCSTIFSMRLSNELDQNFVRAAVPDGAAELLSFLPSLGTAETMVFGESVNLPMRVVLNTLPEQYRPHSSSASFTELWAGADCTPEFMDKVFDQWRSRSLQRDDDATTPSGVRRPAATQSATPNAASDPRAHMQRLAAERAAAQPTGLRQAVMQNEAIRNAAQRLERPQQSLAEVKSLLNNAFNREP